VTPAEPQPAAPALPEDPIERAQMDQAYRQEFTTRLKEEWSKNEWVLAQEQSYWQGEMDRETRMFKRSLEELDGEEAKLREELGAQRGIFKGSRKEQIEQQIEDVDRQRGLCIQSHERNLESFKEKSSPERILQKAFSDTKGQRPELFAQMSALGIAQNLQ
jgi:curved DNA-binding protein CbpA